MEVVEFARLINIDNEPYAEIVWMSVEADSQKDSLGKPYLKVTRVSDHVMLGPGAKRDFLGMKIIDYDESLERLGACVFHLDNMEKYRKQSHAAISTVFSIV